MTAKTMPSYVEMHTQHQGYICDSKGNHLSEVYGRYSDGKARAWGRCEDLCADACMMMHGSDAQGASVRLMD